MHSTRLFNDGLSSGSPEGHLNPLQAEGDVRSAFEPFRESEDLLETAEVEERRELRQLETAGTIFVRAVALLCACSLSIGSH